MIIQKQLTGDVWLVENGENIKTLSAQCTFSLSYKKAGIDVIDLQGRQFFIPLVRVQATQVLPAAEVKFTGDLFDLWDLLVSNFFNELHIVSSSTGVGAVITAVGAGTYNILDTDQLIYATANNTMVLPLTAIRKRFTVFANAFTTEVEPQVGDDIIGQSSIILAPYSSATFICLFLNTWLIE